MKYKVYIIKYDGVTNITTLIECTFNYGCGYDSIEEAYTNIEKYGDDYVQYTILPYICMVK